MSLRRAIAKGTLNLSLTDWVGRVDFREAEIRYLSWDSEDRPSSVTGVFDAREAKFKQAVIKDVHFSNLVDFSDTELGKGGNIAFENVTFEKEVDFLRATFWNDAIFVRNRFRGAWDLTGVTFKEQKERASLCLSFNRISKLFMDREHLGYAENFFSIPLWSPPLERSRIRGVRDKEYSCADPDKSREKNESEKEKTNEGLQDIYKTIELSFRETNDRQGENEAWYLGQVVDQNWVPLIFLDIPSRYGIDIYRVVWVSACFMIFFAIIIYLPYFLWHININRWEAWVKLKPLQDQKRSFRFRPVEQFFKNSGKQARLLHPLKDALFLSGRAFFKLGLGTTYPHRRGLVWIAYIEWIVGMYMLIHFLFTVKNTLPIALPFLAP